MKNVCYYFLIYLLTLSLVISCGVTPTLQTDKKEYTPAEKITVNFVASSKYSEDAWIGIIPSEVPHGDEANNDSYDIDYQYLQKKAQGTITFTAPLEAGSYDFRMHDTDNNGKEVASVTFKVVAVELIIKLTLDKQEYKKGENIAVNYNSNYIPTTRAWVGIIPSNIEHGNESLNDQHDLQYLYLSQTQVGTLNFTAPDSIGEYDIRAHDTDDDGKEIASVSFKVY